MFSPGTKTIPSWRASNHRYNNCSGCCSFCYYWGDNFRVQKVVKIIFRIKRFIFFIIFFLPFIINCCMCSILIYILICRSRSGSETERPQRDEVPGTKTNPKCNPWICFHLSFWWIFSFLYWDLNTFSWFARPLQL